MSQKQNIIAALINEYDIKSTEAIQSMLEALMLFKAGSFFMNFLMNCYF